MNIITPRRILRPLSIFFVDKHDLEDLLVHLHEDNARLLDVMAEHASLHPEASFEEKLDAAQMLHHRAKQPGARPMTLLDISQWMMVMRTYRQVVTGDYSGSKSRLRHQIGLARRLNGIQRTLLNGM